MKTTEQKVTMIYIYSTVKAFIGEAVYETLNNWNNHTLDYIIDDVIKFHTVLAAEYLEDISFLDEYALTYDEVKPLVLQELIALGEAGHVDCGLDNDGKAVWTRSDYFRDYLGYQSKQRIAQLETAAKRFSNNCVKLGLMTNKSMIQPVWPFPA